jgi:hypothetical protein
MALDLQGFTTPEQSFAGLFHLAHDLRDDKARKEREAQQSRAMKATSGKFLADYLDPKDFLTGTNYDPLRTQRVADLMEEGMSLINKDGVTENSMLMAALAPKVNKLIQEGEVIKAAESQRKQAMDLLKDKKGINKQKFNDAFKDYVFYETDENGQKKLKDISQLDPSKNYADEVLRTQDVYDATGFDDWIQKSGKEVREKDVKLTDEKGGMKQTKIAYTSPQMIKPEVDERGVFTGEFVPEYENLYRDGKPVVDIFNGKKGIVRGISKDVWDFGMIPGAKAFALQEARNDAKRLGIPVSDPRVEDHARAIAYDITKASAKQHSTFREVVAEKMAPAPKYNINVNTGTPAQTIEYGNEFDAITVPQELSTNGVQIENGIVTKTADGSNFSGEVRIPKQYVPMTIAAGIKALNNDDALTIEDDSVKAQVQDGKIVSLKTNAVSFTRNNMSVAQRKLDVGRKDEGAAKFGGGTTPKPSGKPQKKMTLAERMRANAQKK